MRHFQWVLKDGNLGSKILGLNFYLNAGMGDPCAGHKTAKCDPKVSYWTWNLSFVLNFGPALPIGSVFENIII